MFLGLRLLTTTPVYDDPEHPDRPTAFIQTPAWTPEDRGLLLGLDWHEAEAEQMCACGQPISVAWHSDTDGWWKSDVYVCFACTAREGGDHKVKYAYPRLDRDLSAKPLPPFRLGGTTTDD